MRRRHYPSDTTDAEWSLLEPLLPPAAHDTGRGRPEKHPRREVVDGIRYLVDNGIKWRAMPADFPPWRTIYGFHQWWAASGAVARIRDQLRHRVRVRAGRSPRAVTAILDSQSVKAAETVAKASRGFDGGKLINGRKRRLAVGSRGLLLTVMVTPASPHDSVPARDFLLRLMHPQLTMIWGDSAYGGTLIDWAKSFLHLTVKVVSKPKGQKGFKVLPRRWRVERTISW
ncbi:transposase [Streptomyces sp. WM6378]|nr:transposase [Streptomyces sp. WM6378]